MLEVDGGKPIRNNGRARVHRRDLGHRVGRRRTSAAHEQHLHRRKVSAFAKLRMKDAHRSERGARTGCVPSVVVHNHTLSTPIIAPVRLLGPPRDHKRFCACGGRGPDLFSAQAGACRKLDGDRWGARHVRLGRPLLDASGARGEQRVALSHVSLYYVLLCTVVTVYTSMCMCF